MTLTRIIYCSGIKLRSNITFWPSFDGGRDVTNFLTYPYWNTNKKWQNLYLQPQKRSRKTTDLMVHRTWNLVLQVKWKRILVFFPSFAAFPNHFYAFTTGYTPETLSWTGCTFRCFEPFSAVTLFSQCPKIHVESLCTKGILSVSGICIQCDVRYRYITLPYGKGVDFLGGYCCSNVIPLGSMPQ